MSMRTLFYALLSDFPLRWKLLTIIITVWLRVINGMQHYGILKITLFIEINHYNLI